MAVPFRQRSTMPERLGFSSAAATRSLSFSCLLTAASLAWPPGLTAMSTCRGHGIQGLQPHTGHRTVAATQPAGRLLLVFEHRWFCGLWQRHVIIGNGHDACVKAAALKALRQGVQQLHTDARPVDKGLGFQGLGNLVATPHLEALRQGAQQLHPDAQPDERRHAAVLHRGRELHPAAQQQRQVGSTAAACLAASVHSELPAAELPSPCRQHTCAAPAGVTGHMC